MSTVINTIRKAIQPYNMIENIEINEIENVT